MTRIRFATPPGAALNERDVRHLADQLERQPSIPAQTAASKLMEAVALPHNPPQPVVLNPAELLTLRELLRESRNSDPTLAEFRETLEQSLG